MNLNLFISTFALIFVAELPDKTAFATLILATRNSPFPIFIGACAAFVIQSLIAVLFGNLFGLLPHSATRIGAAILFFIFAVLMWRRKETEDDKQETAEAPLHGFWKTASHSFMIIFIAEWGDITQLATAALVAKNQEPLTIFLSATLALWAVTGLAVIIGNRAKSIIHPKALQKVAAVAFVGVGVYMLLDAFGMKLE